MERIIFKGFNNIQWRLPEVQQTTCLPNLQFAAESSYSAGLRRQQSDFSTSLPAPLPYGTVVAMTACMMKYEYERVRPPSLPVPYCHMLRCRISTVCAQYGKARILYPPFKTKTSGGMLQNVT